MSQPALTSAGLTKAQAQIYEYLLNNKEAKANKITRDLKISRGTVYYTLDELISLKLAEKIDAPNQISRFRAEHPAVLQKIFEQKEKGLIKEKSSLSENLPDLISAFNLINNKPGVKFYEGKEGIAAVFKYMAGNFKPDTEIISFVKVLPAEFEIQTKEAFSGYIKKRIALSVKTRVVAIDSAESRELKKNDDKSLRQTRLAMAKDLPLDFPGGEIFIYGEEICSLTVDNNVYFAFTVQSKGIAQLLKAFFEVEWRLLESGETTPASSSFKSSGAESFSKTA